MGRNDDKNIETTQGLGTCFGTLKLKVAVRYGADAVFIGQGLRTS